MNESSVAAAILASARDPEKISEFADDSRGPADGRSDRDLRRFNCPTLTVLSAIGGYAELLETGVHGTLSEPREQDVRRIQRAYRHLAALVDDLLSYSRRSRGTIELTMTPVVASELLWREPDLASRSVATWRGQCRWTST